MASLLTKGVTNASVLPLLAHRPKQILIIKWLLFDDTETATPCRPNFCRLILLAKFAMPLQSSGFRFIKQTIEPISQVICGPSVNTGDTHTEQGR